jgi:replicative DNA helicase
MSTPDVAFERGLPASIDAERSILGAILLDNGAYYEASEQIEADDFALDSHRRIFQRMGDLMDDQRAVDIVTLTEELMRQKETNAIGGVAYLASLTEGLPRRISIDEYIRIVREKSVSRQLIGTSSTAITRAADQCDPPSEIIINTIEQLEDSLARDRRRSGRSTSDIIAEDGPRFEAEASAPRQGVLGASLFTSGISDATSGIQMGELCLLCARPHQGKTEAAIQAIVANARRGLRVHFFSLEMKASQIVRRMARYIAMVPITHMRDPRRTKDSGCPRRGKKSACCLS